MSVAATARLLLAPAAKTLAPRLFWRRKYGIRQRLGESRSDVLLVRLPSCRRAGKSDLA
jgi:hypothetical protein